MRVIPLASILYPKGEESNNQNMIGTVLVLHASTRTYPGQPEEFRHTGPLFHATTML